MSLPKDLKIFDLTPLEEMDGVWYKRDDLYCPFGPDVLNGGKLRQGVFLLSLVAEKGYNRIVTGCSILSAQAPVAAATARYWNMPCVVWYGTSQHQKHHMPRLVKYFGAEIKVAPSGRSNVLHHRAKQEMQAGDFFLEYGINCQNTDFTSAFYDVTANQVQNLPDDLDNLVVDCGSGITSTGILLGLKKYNKKVKNVWLIGTAPNREKKIRDRLATLSILLNLDLWNLPFHYVDLYVNGLKYEDQVKAHLSDGSELHPHYEAKAYQWMQDNPQLFEGQKNVFWIVGSLSNFLRKEK